jgi:hypothetical protein
MPMTSNQISALAMQQQQMFAGNMAYAQMLSPVAPGMAQMTAAAYNAPIGTYPTQHLAENMLGGGLGLATTVGRGALNIGGLAAMGAGVAAGFGIGGPLMAAAGGLPGLMALGAFEVAQFAVENVYTGVRQRQDVNRILRQYHGQRMGIGQGRGGMGFGVAEMGDMSTMIREMAGDDIFAQVDDLTRVLERTSQMRMYRGVQNAQQFRQRFRDLVGGLKEIAETLHTSLEGATEYLDQQRQMGFFRGQDISQSLMRTRMISGATGLGMAEMQQIGMQGAAIGRMMGMRGRVGAAALQGMAGNIALAVGTGSLSEEMLSEATGGLTGPAAAQAMAGRMMEINQRWLSRNVGPMSLAGFWDPTTGGIDRSVLSRAASGELSFGELRAIARRNIARSGGRQSEFFRDEERLRGMLMQEAGGDVMLGMLGQHFEQQRGLSLDDPIMQRWLRRHLGASQAEVETMVEMRRQLPQLLEERQVRFRQQVEAEAMNRVRERTGLMGLRRRISNWWERDVEGPLRQAGDDLVTVFTESIDKMTGELEGRINTHVGAAAQQAAKEFARTGEMRAGSALMTLDQARAYERAHGITTGTGAPTTGLGRIGVRLGMRDPGTRARLEAMGAFRYGTLDANATAAEMEQYWNRVADRAARIPSELGLEGERLSNLQREVNQAVVFNKYRAGFDPSTDPTQHADFLRKRITLLQEKVPEFARLTTNKSWEEQLAVLGPAEGKLAGRYKSPVSGLGAMSLADLEGRLRQHREIQQQLLREMNQANRPSEPAYTGWMIGGDVTAFGGYADRRTEADFAGLFRAAGENAELQRYIRAAGGEAVGVGAREARTELSLLAEGGGITGPLAGVSLTDTQRRALWAGLNNQEQMGRFVQYLEGDRAQAAIIMNSHYLKRAQELSQWLGRHAEEAGDRLRSNAAVEFRRHLERVQAGQADRGELAAWYLRYGGTEEMANLRAVLEQEEGGPGAHYAAGMSAMSRVYRELTRGARSGTERSRRLLAHVLGSAGVRDEDLGTTPGAARQFQMQMARALQGGGSVNEVMRRLRELGALENIQVGADQLREELERVTAGVIHTGGTTTAEEAKKYAAEVAAGRALGGLGEGPSDQRSLPDLARDQVERLDRLIEINEQMAQHAGVKITITNRPDGEGGTTTDVQPPSGKNAVQVEI